MEMKRLFENDQYNVIQFVSGSGFTSMLDKTASINLRNSNAHEGWHTNGLRSSNLKRKIHKFTNLGNNWDDNGALMIATEAIKTAFSVTNLFTVEFSRCSLFAIHVFPMRDGGIQFEIDSKTRSAEIEIGASSEITFTEFDKEGNIIEKEEVNFIDLLDQLTSLMDSVYA
jgi:hypothetical protein